MFKKYLWAAAIIAVLSGIAALSAYEGDKRLHSLNELNVKKNSYRLFRTNKCPRCYLVNAHLSGIDLSHADLRGANLIGVTFINATLIRAKLGGAKIAGANFTGAQWVDGSICQAGSIGRCIKKQSE
ncbi:MAG: pentapeptide repeat-containing protein [Proteobacteria bacterium]|nr:pentapeptide repeat-containing protein [Pseudomonadota bacterium]